ncbi:hypothetical protein, partial [Methylobacterium dankookense]|uniref:hypothetical protein n=1 Tax=Methylobacterium dankookense TaxID=560405 RepID=UPI001AEE2BA6
PRQPAHPGSLILPAQAGDRDGSQRATPRQGTRPYIVNRDGSDALPKCWHNGGCSTYGSTFVILD